MATTITCDNIEQEADRLLQLFNACYKLTATDMDDLVNLAYSASLCGEGGGGGAINQNNIFTEILLEGTPQVNASVTAAVNAQDTFTVDEKEIVIFNHTYMTAPDVFNVTIKTDFYLLKSGKGTYGSGGTQVVDNNLFLLKSNTTNIPSDNDVDTAPALYNLYVGAGETIDTPHTSVNNSTSSYVIASGQDSYFHSFNTFIGNSDSKLYRFIGDPGTYGASPTETAVLGDFLLVESFNSSFTTPTEQKILAKEIIVGEVIVAGSATSNIVEAIDNSFTRGVISCSDKELLIFSVQRQNSFIGGDPNTVNLITEKWLWKNGETSDLTSGATVNDFIRIETTSSLTIESGSFANAPEIVAIEVFNLDAPHTAVNALATSIVVDDNDLYVKLFTGIFSSNTPNYKLYRFTGGDGTYGLNDTATTLGQFTLVEEYSDINTNITVMASNVYFNATTEIVATNVQDAIESLVAYADANVPTGLEALNEGNGIGWRLIGRTPADYGNIGLNAIDFGTNNAGTNVGALGPLSFVGGEDNIARGQGDVIFGYGNETGVNGNTVNFGNFIQGINITGYNYQGYSASFGEDHILSLDGADGNNGINYWGLTSGRKNTLRGKGSAALGLGLINTAAGCTVVGIGNADVTDTIATQSTASTNIAANPAFIVGIGEINTSYVTTTPKNGLEVFRTGQVNFPFLTTALIDAAGNDSAVTKEWVQANSAGGATIYAANITPATTVETTSGTLVIGKKYVVDVLEAGDDFSNVGYVSEGVVFTATNTTPTVWSNGSAVINETDSQPTINILANTTGETFNWTWTYVDGVSCTVSSAVLTENSTQVFSSGVSNYATVPSYWRRTTDTTITGTGAFSQAGIVSSIRVEIY